MTADNYLQGVAAGKGLGRRAVSGGMVVVVSQVLKNMLRLGGAILLARILVPKDFGIVAMVAAITNFIAMFKDMGLSMATIHQAEISHEQVSALFWLNNAVSAGLMVITIVIAPAIAWFYDEPRLTAITIWTSLGFLLGGLSIQHRALMQRNLQIATLSAIEMASMALGTCVGVAVAVAWHNYTALVAMQVSTIAFFSLGTILLSPWRPGRYSRSADVAGMVRYGGNITGFSIVNYFSRNLDNVLIGKYCGPQQLGFYDRAYQLMMIPMQQLITPLSSIAVTVLSRLKDDVRKYRKSYCLSLSMLAYLVIPGMAAVVAMCDVLVLVVLGPQWEGAIRIFRILAIAALLQPLAGTVGWVYMSRGRTDRMLRWGVASAPLYVGSFFFGLPWGAVGVAVSYTICFYVLLVPSLAYAFRGNGLAVKDFFGSILCPVVIGLVLYPALKGYSFLAGEANPVLVLLGAIVVMVAVFCAMVLAWPKARSEMRSILSFAGDYRKGTRVAIDQ